jgi:hypothetical protein
VLLLGYFSIKYAIKHDIGDDDDNDGMIEE